MNTRLKLSYALVPPTVIGNSASVVARALNGDAYQAMFTAGAGTTLPAPGGDLELYYRYLVGHPHVAVSVRRHQNQPLSAEAGHSDPITTVFTPADQETAPTPLMAQSGV